jgi:hypothetical protein
MPQGCKLHPSVHSRPLAGYLRGALAGVAGGCAGVAGEAGKAVEATKKVTPAAAKRKVAGARAPSGG